MINTKLELIVMKIPSKTLFSHLVTLVLVLEKIDETIVRKGFGVKGNLARGVCIPLNAVF